MNRALSVTKINLLFLVFVCLVKSFESLLNNHKSNGIGNLNIKTRLVGASPKICAKSTGDGVGFNEEIMKLPIIQIHKLQSDTNPLNNLTSVYYSLESEFFCGQDVDFSLRKVFFVLKSFLSSCSQALQKQDSSLFVSNQISNLYSDDQINSVLTSSTVISSSQSLLSFPSYIVFYLSRTGCQQCSKAEPLYASLPSQLTATVTTIIGDGPIGLANTIKAANCFQFYQANVEYVPMYMSALRKRLSGIKSMSVSSSTTSSSSAGAYLSTNSNTNKSLESQPLLSTELDEEEEDSSFPPCAVCSNTGFIKCTECLGKGFIKRGGGEGSSSDNSNNDDIAITRGGAAAAIKAGVAVFCPTCTGYKSIRCPACGGRCMQCTV